MKFWGCIINGQTLTHIQEQWYVSWNVFFWFYTIFFDWMYAILACPTRCSAKFSECKKWLNYIKFKYFFNVLIVLSKLFNKTSHFDYLYFMFIIILSSLHVSLKLLSTLSLWGKRPFKKPTDVLSDIPSPIWSFFSGG